MFEKFFNPRVNKSIDPVKEKDGLLFYNPNKKRRFFFWLSIVLVFFVIGYLIFLSVPFLGAIAKYRLKKIFLPARLSRRVTVVTSDRPRPTTEPTPTLPPNEDVGFSIIIPKIDASAKIIDRVSVDDDFEYKLALKEGVAHAAGTAFPGDGKTIYLFAHSTIGEWNVIRYNAVFFLLSRLELGDEVWVIYQNKLYPYLVVEEKIVGPNDLTYLREYQDGETLILQTCYPPGTTLKRFLTFAKPKTPQLQEQLKQATEATPSATK